jgi:hypothetical protein
MNNNEKSDLRELILRHDERMNELQKNGDEHRKQFNEFMTWAKTHAAEVNARIARLDRESAEHQLRFNEFMTWAKTHAAEVDVRIARLGRESAEHQLRFNEFMKWARESDERIKNSDAKFDSLIASLYESQITSSARMDRVEKNLDRLEKNLDLLIESMRGGRNGKDGR